MWLRRSGRLAERWQIAALLRSRVGMVALPAMLVAGLGLAGAAQYFIGRDLEGGLDSWHFPAGLFRGVYPYPRTVLLAVVLFAAGGLLFVLAVRWMSRDSDAAAVAASVANRWRPPRAAAALALASLGLLLYLVINLARGSYHEFYPYLFVASALASAGFWLAGARWRPRWSLRVNWYEACAVGLITAVFIAINVRDLTSWYYSAIGDEYSFFQTASAIGDGETKNLFSQAGVYENHPLASSAYQAMVMKVFGSDQFGWRMSSLLAAAAVIPVLYLLVRMLFGVRPALLSTVLFASSHYLFAYAHLGYDSILPLFPTVLCLLLFVVGMRKGSAFALFGAGCAAGLGFYTFYSSRGAIVILALYLVTLGRRGLRPRELVPLAWGFVLFVAPMFAVDRLDVFNRMTEQSVVGYDSSTVGEMVQRLRGNVPRSMLAFNYNNHTQHFVAGSLLDPISAVLATLGLLYCFSRIRHEGYRLLAIWFGVGVVATGFFFPVGNVAISRLHYLLPVLAAFAGLALHHTLRSAGCVVVRPAVVSKAAQAVLAAAVLVAAFSLNVERFWHETPQDIPTSAESVAIRAALSSTCRDSPRQTLIIGAHPEPVLYPAVEAYDLGEKTPVLFSFDEPPSASDLSAAGCVVFMPQDDDARSDPLLQTLRGALRGHREERLWDLPHIRYVVVFRPGSQAATTRGHPGCDATAWLTAGRLLRMIDAT